MRIMLCWDYVRVAVTRGNRDVVDVCHQALVYCIGGYTLWGKKKLHAFYFHNNFVKSRPILVIFFRTDTQIILQQNSDKILHLS